MASKKPKAVEPESELFIYAVDDDMWSRTPKVVQARVVRTTELFHFIEKREQHRCWRYSNRVPKAKAYTSARAALEAYIARREREQVALMEQIESSAKRASHAKELLAGAPA